MHSSSPIILLITEVSFLSSPLLMPSNTITDCPIYRVLWDLTACWGKEVHHKYEVNAQWAEIGSGNHITHRYFPPYLLNVTSWYFEVGFLQNASIGYHIWCLEYFTPYRVVWKKKAEFIWNQLCPDSPTLNYFSVEHGWLWNPKKAILARWWQERNPNTLEIV